jgi:hypothetical protein
MVWINNQHTSEHANGRQNGSIFLALVGMIERADTELTSATVEKTPNGMFSSGNSVAATS